MRLQSLLFSFFLTLLFGTGSAAGTEPALDGPKGFKGKFYIYWGYNRGFYTNSDIRFNGSDYDFTLSDVKSHDHQTEVGYDPYLKADGMTIPQTNFRVGYFFKDHWNISIGDDHMKYVMTQDQVVEINGYIKNTPTDYNDLYEHENIALTGDFLKFEHTDGLNYINVKVRRLDNLIRFGKFSPVNIDINLLEGFGAGALVPRTNTTLLGQERYDEFHLSGFGIGGVAGINIMFWDLIFLQSEIKGGFIDMPDIRTTANKNDHASQHFFFTQLNVTLGAQFRLFKPKKGS